MPAPVRSSVIVLVAVLVLLADAGAAAGDVVYEPPVDAPVVDPFRPPAHFAGPGNRGLEYRPAPGTPVRAAADGTVTFAGQVGGDLHVTIAHADGVRTSYSWVSSVEVAVGDTVTRGDVVAVSGAVLHLGARVGDTYIDPATLFGPGRVRLVSLRTPTSGAAEYGSGPAAAVADVVREVLDLAADRLPAWSR